MWERIKDAADLIAYIRDKKIPESLSKFKQGLVESAVLFVVCIALLIVAMIINEQLFVAAIMVDLIFGVAIICILAGAFAEKSNYNDYNEMIKTKLQEKEADEMRLTEVRMIITKLKQTISNYE